MEVVPDKARGGRWSSVLGRLGRPFCAAAPLTLTSSSAPSSVKAPAGPRQSLTAAAAERSAASTVVAAAEARDVLQPLPSMPARSSHGQRFNRSTSSAGQLPVPGGIESFVTSAVTGAAGRQSSRGGGVSFATAAPGPGAVSGKRAAFPSHTLGSLTAWQMLAADVQQEMEAGAAGVGRASDGSELRLSACSSRNRSSQVEPGLIMSECSEVEEGQRRSSSMLFPHHQQTQPQQQQQQTQPQQQQQQQRASGAGSDSTAATEGSTSSSGGQLASDGSLTGEAAAAAAAADGAPAT